MWFPIFAAGSDAPFSIFSPLHLNPALLHVAMSGIATIVLALLARSIYRHYQTASNPVIPSDRLNIANIFELMVEQLLNFFQSLLGDRAIQYFPLLGTIFIYIFISNILGLIPGFLPPTDNINTNLPVALVVFVYYNMEGIKEHGAKSYLAHFMGPINWLAFLMIPIEIISHFVRPISLSLRLFGNMTGDHMVLSQFSNLTPMLLPIIFLGLGLFVCFMQAFVFTFLSAIYISLAKAHDH